ncbi:MAG: histidine kinase dimerization/phosphoacceptor domain -containing protein [Pseudomonadota bacterium]
MNDHVKIKNGPAGMSKVVTGSGDFPAADSTDPEGPVKKPLQGSEAVFAACFEYSQDLMLIVDAGDGAILAVNRAVERLLGYKPSEVLHERFSMLYPAENQNGRLDRLESTKVLDGVFQAQELVHADGTTIHMDLVAHLIPWGGKHAMLAVFRDARDRRKAEEELIQARRELEIRVEERTRELLAANVMLTKEVAQRKQAEEQIRASLTEKETLLNEIHHRVKNNLQIVSSLIALQRSRVSDTNIRAALQDSQGRIKAMAMIHEQLYQAKNLARIDFGRYLGNLSRTLLTSCKGSEGAVTLKLHINPIFLDMDRAVPCGLIANELISNCLKHAFPDNREGEIRVELHPKGEDGFELVVADNGVGLPDELDVKELKTLGLKLVFELAEAQLKGTVAVFRDRGTEFGMTFKRGQEGKR